MSRLTVVYSDHDLLDDGSNNTGVAGNAPEARKWLVQQALRGAAGVSSPPSLFIRVPHKEPSIYELGQLVHSPGLLGYLATCWPRWEQEWHSTSSRDHLVGVFCSPGTPHDATQAPQFCAGFFAPRHESTSGPGASVFSQACFYAMDKETPISSTTLVGLEWDLAVTREAVKRLLSKDGGGGVVYSQITHPGHHAFASSYGGFCFLNQAAIATKLIQQQQGGANKRRRVAIVDVDFHCGNGTSQIFADQDDVFFASLHADPNEDYPYNFFPPSATKNQLHVNLPKNGCVWAQYRPLLQRVVDRVVEFQPEALVVSLGVDTLRGDPVALPGTRCALKPEDYAEMGKMLLACERLAGVPMLVVQEGGYKLDEVHLAVAAFLSAAAAEAGSKL